MASARTAAAVLLLVSGGWGVEAQQLQPYQQPATPPPKESPPQQAGAEEAARTAAAGARDVMIGPEDVVSIYALDAEELSRTWRVNATGELNLPLIGKVQAAGLTVEQFERALTERMRSVIRFPQVFVSVTEIRSQPVTVVGAVGKTGALQLAGRRTLLQVLLEAGGPVDPGPNLTVTRRREYGPIPLPGSRPAADGNYSVVELDVEKVMEGRSDASNLVMRPFDLVTVSPKPRFQKLVHIIGEVNRPGAIELVQQPSVTVMQALAAAGGATRTASLRRGMIMHVNPEGVRTEIAMVDLKKITEGKVKDLELVPGDIVVVPSSQWRQYLDLSTRSMAAGSLLILTRF